MPTRANCLKVKIIGATSDIFHKKKIVDHHSETGCMPEILRPVRTKFSGGYL